MGGFWVLWSSHLPEWPLLGDSVCVNVLSGDSQSPNELSGQVLSDSATSDGVLSVN